MTSKTWRARTRISATLIAAATIVSACGAVPGLGDDDATAAVGAPAAAATETTLAGAAAVENPLAEEPDGESASVDDGAAEAARAFGRTGPIRELPGLAAWADVDLHPFLVEVMNMPPETPIPDGAALTYADVTQYMKPTESSLTFQAHFLPMFERDEFRIIIPALLESTIWTATEIDEDLENASTTLSFGTDDESAPYYSISFTFKDETAERQAQLSIYTSANNIYGPEPIGNDALFPWMAVAVVDPTMVDDFIRVSLGRLDNWAEIDRRWEAPIDSFETLSAFYVAPTFAEFTPDVQVYSDSVWPSNEVDVTRPDGFDGEVEVWQTDPEREVGVQIRGHYDLS